MKDYFGRDVQAGDVIVYGKSDRNRPLNVGTVKEVWGTTLAVLGNGNTKLGEISDSKRVVVITGLEG